MWCVFVISRPITAGTGRSENQVGGKPQGGSEPTELNGPRDARAVCERTQPTKVVVFVVLPNDSLYWTQPMGVGSIPNIRRGRLSWRPLSFQAMHALLPIGTKLPKLVGQSMSALPG
jgi:hypothetical protein